MVDGRCPVLRWQINGRYEIEVVGAREADMRFFELRDVDPYGKSPELKEIQPLVPEFRNCTNGLPKSCVVITTPKTRLTT